jgi:adenosylhomocysteinase
VMDMSFANQALGLEFVRANASTLENDVYTIPEIIDREIARLKLASMGVQIDTLTDEQAKYLSSWQEGT